ncbi:2OG-Fe(II) oxygenase [Leptolyngbya sp. PL-A3]|nr:2OG-Fe(II) oxygenase [Leptolyngbya sp. FACHB-8]
MERYRFGKGEYKYFAYPLPPLVQTLRDRLYPHLSPLANRWNEALNTSFRFPNTLPEFLELCHQSGQQRPTPLLLKYKAEDYNCLHQDLYGEMAFPLQVAIALSQPNQDYTGGEFILIEQKPRAQSRAHAITLNQGDAIIFAVHHRPVQGSRGFYRVNLKHGVSTIKSGQRYCLGIIFHDAK